MNKSLVLTEADRQSALWLKIKSTLEQRLISHRTKNDTQLNEIETATLRGRIAEIKKMLDLETGPVQGIDASE